MRRRLLILFLLLLVSKTASSACTLGCPGSTIDECADYCGSKCGPFDCFSDGCDCKSGGCCNYRNNGDCYWSECTDCKDSPSEEDLDCESTWDSGSPWGMCHDCAYTCCLEGKCAKGTSEHCTSWYDRTVCGACEFDGRVWSDGCQRCSGDDLLNCSDSSWIVGDDCVGCPNGDGGRSFYTNVCSGSSCLQELCPAADRCCDGECFNLMSDPNNCGSCGNQCGGETPFCLNGGCSECATDADCPGCLQCDDLSRECEWNQFFPRKCSNCEFCNEHGGNYVCESVIGCSPIGSSCGCLVCEDEEGDGCPWWHGGCSAAQTCFMRKGSCDGFCGTGDTCENLADLICGPDERLAGCTHLRCSNWNLDCVPLPLEELEGPEAEASPEGDGGIDEYADYYDADWEVDVPDVPDVVDDLVDVSDVDLDGPDVPDVDGVDLDGVEVPDVDGVEVPDVDGVDVPDVDGVDVPDVDGVDLDELDVPEVPDVGDGDLDLPVTPDVGDVVLDFEVDDGACPLSLCWAVCVDDLDTDGFCFDRVVLPFWCPSGVCCLSVPVSCGEVELPEDVDLDGVEVPDVDGLEVPDVDVDGLEVPDVDGVDLDDLDVPEVPDVDLDGVEVPDVDVPEVPDVDSVDVDVPDVVDGDVDVPGDVDAGIFVRTSFSEDSSTPSLALPGQLIADSLLGLSSCCNGRTGYIVDYRGCSYGLVICACTLTGDGCSCSFNAPLSEGVYGYFGCVDVNNDGDFSDLDEQSPKEFMQVVSPDADVPGLDVDDAEAFDDVDLVDVVDSPVDVSDGVGDSDSDVELGVEVTPDFDAELVDLPDDASAVPQVKTSFSEDFYNPTLAFKGASVVDTIFGLTGCCDGTTGYLVNYKGCSSGIIVCACTISADGCSCGFNAPVVEGLYGYFGCVDVNNDGDFNDFGEQSPKEFLQVVSGDVDSDVDLDATPDVEDDVDLGGDVPTPIDVFDVDGLEGEVDAPLDVSDVDLPLDDLDDVLDVSDFDFVSDAEVTPDLVDDGLDVDVSDGDWDDVLEPDLDYGPTPYHTPLPPPPRGDTCREYFFEMEWGMYGIGPGEFDSPAGIAVSPDGFVYVLDRGNNRIQKFTQDGVHVRDVVYDRLTEPTGIVFRSDGRYLVAGLVESVGRSEYSLVEFSHGDEYVRKILDPLEPFYEPVDLAVDSEHIFVANAGIEEVYVHSSDGVFSSKWSLRVDGDLGNPSPGGVAVDSEGSVYVSDYINSKVKKFSVEGILISVLSTPLGFIQPRDVYVDEYDYVYVADSGGKRIQKLAKNGSLITFFGATGSGEGEFNNPRYVHETGLGKAFVSDSGLNKIQVWDCEHTLCSTFDAVLDVANDSSHPWEWSVSGVNYSNERVWIDPGEVNNKINNILAKGCLSGSCLDCRIDGGDCLIPFSFKTKEPLNPFLLKASGNITVEDINFSYWIIDTIAEVPFGSRLRFSEGLNLTVNYETESEPAANASYIVPSDCSFNCNDWTYMKDSPPSGIHAHDVVDDALYRLLDEKLDVSPKDGVIDQLDVDDNGVAETFFDAESMWFDVEDRLGVQTLWGPVNAKLIVWSGDAESYPVGKTSSTSVYTSSTTTSTTTSLEVLSTTTTTSTTTSTTTTSTTSTTTVLCGVPSYPYGYWDRTWCNRDFTEKLAGEPDQVDLNFDENWGGGTVAGIRNDNLGFRSGRTLTFTISGAYEFTVGADDGVRLWIDGTNILDDWSDHGYRTVTTERIVSAGDHSLRVDYYESGWDARVSFNYMEVTTTTIKCPPTYPVDRWDRVWCNKNFDTFIADEPDKIELTFDEDWGGGTVAGIRSDDLAFRSGRTVTVTSDALYQFTIGSDDGTRLWVDGEKILDVWGDHAYETRTTDYTLPSGEHQLRLDYYENGGGARVSFGMGVVTSTTTTTTTTIIPCPAEPTYPTDKWDRVWCDSSFAQKLADEPDKTELSFNENWGDGAVAGIRNDNIGFRSGRTINFPTSGDVEFTVGSDDGTRLYLDGTQIIDNWGCCSTRSTTEYVTGGDYQIRLDFREDWGGAWVSFNYGVV